MSRPRVRCYCHRHTQIYMYIFVLYLFDILYLFMVHYPEIMFFFCVFLLWFLYFFFFANFMLLAIYEPFRQTTDIIQITTTHARHIRAVPKLCDVPPRNENCKHFFRPFNHSHRKVFHQINNKKSNNNIVTSVLFFFLT